MNNKWLLAKSFDINDYVDSSWDEAINCNNYETEKIKKNVNKRISKFSKYKGCPISAISCRELINKYKKVQGNILHPLCIKRGISTKK